METKTRIKKGLKVKPTLSEMLQELKPGDALEIPLWRRQGAMSIISYWKTIARFPERTFKSRKKDKNSVYIIRVS